MRIAAHTFTKFLDEGEPDLWLARNEAVMEFRAWIENQNLVIQGEELVDVQPSILEPGKTNFVVRAFVRQSTDKTVLENYSGNTPATECETINSTATGS